MDADRVRSYLQAACAGLGFDIGEVWWMSNEKGTSTVAAIEEIDTNSGNDCDSSGEETFASLTSRPRKRQGPIKRFMQLYTSKAYRNQRSKLVHPEPEREPGTEEDQEDVVAGEGSSSVAVQKNRGTPADHAHVLSPRIVDAVTNSAQVVWANCQKQEGLLGRSDVKLQTAIGMPVGVDDSGNVWVVVMFSPKNVENNVAAIDYLQYISKSAASASIPCLLPVIPAEEKSETNHHKTILDDKHAHHHNSLVALKPTAKPRCTTQDLGEGVVTRFVQFELNDDEEFAGSDKADNFGKVDASEISAENHDLSNAPKDDFGIPMLPADSELVGKTGASAGNSQQVGDAFDDASYGVWSTIMNSPDGDTSKSTTPTIKHNAVVSQLEVAKGRLEEFASAFLGMSVFDVADAWVPTNGENSQTLGLLFSVAATEKSAGINRFREVSACNLVGIGSGAIGRAYSLGHPVWSSNKELMFDGSRIDVFHQSKIETVFAVPIFSTGAILPACILCCYSLLRTESVPFVLNFVQKAVRLLWDGLDRVDPHDSVGKKLWKDVAPADLGEMAADLEMQKAFIGKKRRRTDSLAGIVSEARQMINPTFACGPSAALRTTEQVETRRERSSSLYTQMNALPNPAPSPTYPMASTNAPPQKGLRPAPILPTTVQVRPKPIQQAGSFSVGHDGHRVVQQAIRSVGHVVPWKNGTHATAVAGVVPSLADVSATLNTVPAYLRQENTIISNQPSIAPSLYSRHLSTSDSASTFSLAYVNYSSSEVTPLGYQLQPGKPSPAAAHPPSARGIYVDDPAVIRANINEFNALARLHEQPQLASAWGSGESLATPPIPKNVTTKFDFIPSYSDGESTILKAPQALFCTPTKARECYPGPMFNSTPPASNGKKCRIQGCEDVAVTKRPYCLRHCGNRQCEHKGCTKCAQGATRYCIAHGGGRRCTFPGCDKGARDKFFCAAHGGGKRCKTQGCTKSAVGGSSFCTSHGGGRRCLIEGCDKSAQSSTNFCVKHGGGKKCQHEGCEKVSRGRTVYCAAHGGGVRCKLQGCNRVAIGKAQLCRAHGGGANSRSRVAKVCPSLTPAPLPS